MQATPVHPRTTTTNLGVQYVLTALGILIGSVVVGIITYTTSSRQPPIYEATSKLLADAAATLPNGLTTGILFNSTNLDSVAYREAALSREVIQRTLGSLKTDVQEESVSQFRNRSSITVSKGSRTISDVYILRYSSSDPDQASKYLNTWAQSLMQWDNDFVRSKIDKYISGLEAQYKALSIAGQQLNSNSTTEEERAYFRQIRGNVFKDLQLFRGLRNSVQGTLRILEKATPPSIPVTPRPKRNAAIASFMSFAVLSGLALLYFARANGRQNSQAFEINL